MTVGVWLQRWPAMKSQRIRTRTHTPIAPAQHPHTSIALHYIILSYDYCKNNNNFNAHHSSAAALLRVVSDETDSHGKRVILHLPARYMHVIIMLVCIIMSHCTKFYYYFYYYCISLCDGRDENAATTRVSSASK